MATIVRWISKSGPIWETTDTARATVATHQAISFRRARLRVTCSRARPANSMTRRLPSGTSRGTQRARVTMAAARRGQRASEDVEGADHADDERHDGVQVVDVQLAHAGLALHAAGADDGGHAEDDCQQDPDPDVLDVLHVPLDGGAAVVAGQPQGAAPR